MFTLTTILVFTTDKHSRKVDIMFSLTLCVRHIQIICCSVKTNRKRHILSHTTGSYNHCQTEDYLLHHKRARAHTQTHMLSSLS